MGKVIVFMNDEGRASVIYPTSDELEKRSVEEIAVTDVPTGKAFRIINASDVPIDRSQRAAWTVDEADLTDGVGQ